MTAVGTKEPGLVRGEDAVARVAFEDPILHLRDATAVQANDPELELEKDVLDGKVGRRAPDGALRGCRLLLLFPS